LLRSAAIAQARLGAAAAGAANAEFYKSKLASARFYADYVLPQAAGLAHGIMHGAAGALAEDAL
jgi:hypothetical protein